MFRRDFATAESCSGGLTAGRLLNVPGASEVYREGYITYSNEAKEKLLGVSHDTLMTCGAVSEETACQMAEGAAKAAGMRRNGCIFAYNRTKHPLLHLNNEQKT